jgi:hypothetical protein
MRMAATVPSPAPTTRLPFLVRTTAWMPCWNWSLAGPCALKSLFRRLISSMSPVVVPQCMNSSSSSMDTHVMMRLREPRFTSAGRSLRLLVSIVHTRSVAPAVTNESSEWLKKRSTDTTVSLAAGAPQIASPLFCKRAGTEQEQSRRRLPSAATYGSMLRGARTRSQTTTLLPSSRPPSVAR